MIRSFRDHETERIFNQQWSTKLPREIQDRALKKLLLLDSAESEHDLRSPPGNHLEHLKGVRSGECSIRINGSGEYAFDSEAAMPLTSESKTIISEARHDGNYL